MLEKEDIFSVWENQLFSTARILDNNNCMYERREREQESNCALLLCTHAVLSGLGL